MALLKIARMGHPVLREAAQPVQDPTSPEIAVLVEDMIDTMIDADGAGLAAPQVHVPLQLVIFHVPGEVTEEDDEELGEVSNLTVLMNPVIEPIGEDTVGDWEGCLSVPGMMGYVERWKKIRYTGIGLKGETIDRTVDGFHAKVVQHECDHLIGRLYPSRIKDFRLFGYSEELRRDPPDMSALDGD